MKIYRYFNMIEITLAIAIIAFGMSSILVLFPVGLNASRDSIADNYSANAVEQFISYIQARCRNKTDVIPSGAPDGIPDQYCFYFIDSTESGVGEDVLFNTTKASPSKLEEDAKAFMTKLAMDRTGGGLNPVQPDWEIYRAAENDGTSGNNKSIYFIIHRSNISATNQKPKYDFMAQMTVWKSPVQLDVYVKNKGDIKFNFNASTTPELYQYSGGLNIEISWPLSKDYESRQKRYFYYTINNPKY
jgi:type II secretory pathway pseudopilin PulG